MEHRGQRRQETAYAIGCCSRTSTIMYTCGNITVMLTRTHVKSFLVNLQVTKLHVVRRVMLAYLPMGTNMDVGSRVSRFTDR